MLNGLYLAAMGAKVQDARADVAANNLANLNTPAFRRDQAVFRLRLSEAEERPSLASRGEPRYERVGGGVFLERIASLDEPGPLEETGRPLDLAIDGEGFLKVRGKQDGQFFYTRAGNLRRDDEGFLVTADGRFRVQGLGGGDIEVPPGQLDINEGGEMYSDGIPVAQIGVVMPDRAHLRKRGDNLWTTDSPAEEVQAAGRLRQGFREGSSVEAVSEMAEMIQAQRAYEMSLRALRIQDEVLGRAVTDVGRVTA